MKLLNLVSSVSLVAASPLKLLSQNIQGSNPTITPYQNFGNAMVQQSIVSHGYLPTQGFPRGNFRGRFSQRPCVGLGCGSLPCYGRGCHSLKPEPMTEERRQELCTGKISSGSYFLEDLGQQGSEQGSGAVDTSVRLVKREVSEEAENVETPTNSTIPTEAPPKNNIRVIFILDETGSMSSSTENTISAFNEYLTSQQQTIEGEDVLPKFSLVKFATSLDIETVETITDAEPLTKQSYRPSGSTALLDAIGCTLAAYGDEEYNIMVILTDGEENSSYIYRNNDEIKELTETVVNDKHWQVEYLGANQDAFSVASSLGISRAQNFSMDKSAYKRVYASLAVGQSQSRATQYKLMASNTN